MAASVAEVITGATSSTAHSVAIATSLVPGDVVVCITSTYNTTSSYVTPSGLGTWSAELGGAYGGTLTHGVRVHMMSGATGAGSITLSQTLAGSGYVVLVIRGLDAPVLNDFEAFLITDSVQTSASLEAAARANSVAVSIAHFTGGTPTNPSAADPASGWTSAANSAGSSGLSVSHNVIAAAQAVAVTLTGAASSFDHAVGLFIFGTPLEPRLNADYAEAAIGGTGATPKRALVADYAEAVLNDGAAGRRTLAHVYGEAIHGGTGRAGVIGDYVETAHAIPPGAIADLRVAAEYAETITQALPGALLAGEYVEAIARPLPPAADATVVAAYAEVVGVAIPPQAGADVHAAQLEVIHTAFTAELGGIYIEAIKRYNAAGGSQFVGWGIPL